ncbi:hypothetical protein [Saccharibacillus alkalitolerans]|uniref:Uncharacterized protein n=1 Tax=Saccharibacillus alkalitolerans TaxID=2705290 RepID=A0ABX0FAJ3_9BACL|nr:hypothetical protein [Saccharibacillus alkalitolerans]NGZ76980.1 hypothetical protein [Saccharibacillus alkalitolerans]
MGYTYQGFIGSADVLNAAAERLRHARVLELTGGWFTVPLGEKLEDEINAGEGGLIELWDILTDRIEALGIELSQKGRIAYVEADYFGGWGDQSCIVWESGSELLREVRTAKAINHALKRLGVAAAEGEVDEFDTVGLGRHRRVESWLAEERGW